VGTVFENVTKVITSEVGLEVTAIAEGTAHNSNVTEKMTEDMVSSHGIAIFIVFSATFLFGS
jgi:hypothetical protein